MTVKMTDINFVVVPVVMGEQQAFEEMSACRDRHHHMLKELSSVEFDEEDKMSHVDKWHTDSMKILEIMEANLDCYWKIKMLLTGAYNVKEEE